MNTFFIREIFSSRFVFYRITLNRLRTIESFLRNRDA
jgi:hypothetical protein